MRRLPPQSSVDRNVLDLVILRVIANTTTTSSSAMVESAFALLNVLISSRMIFNFSFTFEMPIVVLSDWDDLFLKTIKIGLDSVRHQRALSNPCRPGGAKQAPLRRFKNEEISPFSCRPKIRITSTFIKSAMAHLQLFGIQCFILE
jgi:hypothetical protein